MAKKAAKKTKSSKSVKKNAKKAAKPKATRKPAKKATKRAASKPIKSKPVVAEPAAPKMPEPLLFPEPKQKKFGFSSGLLFLGCMFLGLGIGQLIGLAGPGIIVGMGAGFVAMFYGREHEE